MEDELIVISFKVIPKHWTTRIGIALRYIRPPIATGLKIKGFNLLRNCINFFRTISRRSPKRKMLLIQD